jgi:hypothetical protein
MWIRIRNTALFCCSVMLGHLLCTKTQFTLTVFINLIKIFQVKESVALDFILDVLTTVKAEKVSKPKFSDYSFLCSAFKLFGPLFLYSNLLLVRDLDP